MIVRNHSPGSAFLRMLLRQVVHAQWTLAVGAVHSILCLEAGRLYDSAPAGEVGLDQAGELIWRGPGGLKRQLRQTGRNFIGFKSTSDSQVELLDDLGRRPRRNEDAEPLDGFQIGISQ